MVVAGQCTPHFLFSVAPKRENGPCTVQKRKAAGAEFDREGQIRPNAGAFSDGALKFAGLNPAASDPVPPRTALPQM